MQYSLKSLLIVIPIAAVAVWFWDGVNVIKADGGYTLKIAIECSDTDISRISFATARSDLLELIDGYYPMPETSFETVETDMISFLLPWSSTTTQSGRTLHYIETFDSILFRVQYQGRGPKYHVFQIPSRDARDEMKVVL